MKLKILVAALVISGLGASAVTVAGTARAVHARSADLQAQVRAMKKENAQAKAQQTAGISATDVGDADSFGRNVHWLGLMGSGVIELSDQASDCDPANFQGGPDDHCVVLNPQPAITSFDFPDVGRMMIPAKSSNSLFCHMQTPISASLLQNYATPNMTARVVFNPVFTFQNEVLNDPSIIDPSSGLPYNGKITFTLPGIRHQLTLQPGESFFGRDDETRVCIVGMISKAQLKAAGLTDAQATKFFQKDTIVTMGINGNAQGVVFASISNNVRWQGD